MVDQWLLIYAIAAEIFHHLLKGHMKDIRPTCRPARKLVNIHFFRSQRICMRSLRYSIGTLLGLCIVSHEVDLARYSEQQLLHCLAQLGMKKNDLAKDDQSTPVSD